MCVHNAGLDCDDVAAATSRAATQVTDRTGWAEPHCNDVTEGEDTEVKEDDSKSTVS